MSEGVGEAAVDSGETVARSGGVGRLKRFLRRHETTLVIVGSFIALVSFAVREELQTTYRDRLTALGQAEFEHRRRADAEKTESMVRATMLEIGRSNTSAKRLSLDDSRSETLTQFHDNRDLLNDDQAFLDDADLEAGQQRREITAIVASIAKSKSADEDDPHFADDADLISERTAQLARDIDAAGRDERVALQRKLGASNQIGIAMFGLGWLLSLVSKIVGKGAEDDE